MTDAEIAEIKDQMERALETWKQVKDTAGYQAANGLWAEYMAIRDEYREAVRGY